MATATTRQEEREPPHRRQEPAQQPNRQRRALLRVREHQQHRQRHRKRRERPAQLGPQPIGNGGHRQHDGQRAHHPQRQVPGRRGEDHRPPALRRQHARSDRERHQRRQQRRRRRPRHRLRKHGRDAKRRPPRQHADRPPAAQRRPPVHDTERRHADQSAQRAQRRPRRERMPLLHREKEQRRSGDERHRRQPTADPWPPSPRPERNAGNEAGNDHELQKEQHVAVKARMGFAKGSHGIRVVRETGWRAGRRAPGREPSARQLMASRRRRASVGCGERAVNDPTGLHPAPSGGWGARASPRPE